VYRIAGILEIIRLQTTRRLPPIRRTQRQQTQSTADGGCRLHPPVDQVLLSDVSSYSFVLNFSLFENMSHRIIWRPFT